MTEEGVQPRQNLVVRGLTVLCVLIFCLIVVGGTVRTLGAGLSCPDWPLCFGRIIPHFDLGIFAEFFHRVFAGLVTLLTLGLSLVIVMNKSWRALLGYLVLLALILLASQVVLGGLTVLQLLKSEVVTLHLAVGTLFFGVTLNMALRSYRFGRPPLIYSIAKDKKREYPTDTWRYGLAAMAILYVQIILGGMVSSNYAGLACPDFPTCLGQWWPGLAGIVGIHIFHRMGALVTFCAVIAFAIQIKKNKALPSAHGWLAAAMVFLVFLQVSLGIANVLLRLPLIVSVAHLAVAEALFALIVISTYEIRHHQLR